MKILKLAFFLDETWFTLSRNINSQNKCHWCSKNHHAGDKVSLHDHKVVVWSAVGAHQTTGPIFFTKTDYDH
jgi:hypothetical protein